jgi:hypothetical protein
LGDAETDRYAIREMPGSRVWISWYSADDAGDTLLVSSLYTAASLCARALVDGAGA